MILAMLGYTRLMRKDRNDELKRKVDVEIFEEHKLQVNSRLSRKVNKEAFIDFEEEVWDAIKQHESMNEVSFKLLKEDMDKNKDINMQMLKQITEMATDIKWIIQKL